MTKLNEGSIQDSIQGLQGFDSYSDNHSIKDMEALSELRYMAVVNRVVDISDNQLLEQNREKEQLRTRFNGFFKKLVVAQLVAILLFVGLEGFGIMHPNDAVGVSFVVAVFAETLGCISIMIKFAYDSKQEVTILQILNGVVSDYQKYDSLRGGRRFRNPARNSPNY